MRLRFPQRRERVVDLDDLKPFEQATARFNAGEAGRTVAGLVKTLGTPWASVGASAGSVNVVRITVVWEITWYQWGVYLGDAKRPAFELGRGREVSELDSAARQWNASVLDGGYIALTAPRMRPPAWARR